MNEPQRPTKPRLKSVVTYLEMRRRPPLPDLAPPRDDVAVVHALRPTVSFYRYLYNAVGKTWLWWERNQLIDDELRAILEDPAVEVHVLYSAGVPVGYAELDRRKMPDIELAYFGIVPEFIGQGLGPYLLRWAIARAFSFEPHRFWVHTCTLDHPKALATYRRAGFEIYDEKIEEIDDPRAPGNS